MEKLSVPRNPLIAGLMLKARYIEGMGTGIRRMKDMVKKAGLKPIKFKFGNFFTIIFPRNLLYPESGTNGIKNGTNGTNGTKNDSEESIFKGKNKGKLLKILDLIESNDFSIEHFMRKQRIARRTLLRHLKLLKDKGFIFTEGSTKATKYKVTEKYKRLKKKTLISPLDFFSYYILAGRDELWIECYGMAFSLDLNSKLNLVKKRKHYYKLISFLKKCSTLNVFFPTLETFFL